MDESSAAESDTKPRKRWSVLRWLVRAAMWTIVLGFAFSFFGKLFFIAELLANFRTQFCLLLVGSLWLVRPAKASWLLFTCLFFAAAFSIWETGRIYLPIEQPNVGQTQIRVMSFNVLATNTQFNDAIAEIEKHDPDVVAVLEYANMWHVALDALNETYPHQHRDPRWHGYGIAIFSKLPLENAASIPLTKDAVDNPAVSFDVKVDDQLVRMLAVHVMSPIKQYRMELRNRQFEEIVDLVKMKAAPTVVLGDMNCTMSSGFLSDMAHKANLRDSRNGFGIHPSWPAVAGPFAVPIDHAFVSESIHVHDRFLGQPCGSDHRPVIIDLSVRAK